jgi:FkbM family methyltransferase
MWGHELAPEIESSFDRVHIGSEYGGWWVVPQLVSESSIVYGIGVGQDITWDLGMIARFGCTVHGFDPTPRSRTWVESQKLPSKFVFRPFGLAAKDGIARFVMRKQDPLWTSYDKSDNTEGAAEVVELQVRRLSTLMAELGHDHIDVLKMDIEGSEFEVVEDMLATQIRPKLLLVEYHYFENRAVEVPRVKASIALLQKAGYKLFARSSAGPEFGFVLS